MSYKRFKRETQQHIRKQFSLSEKFKVAQRQRLKCICDMCEGKKDLPPEFDLDHIKPLWAGGSNDLSNIQAICPNGHRKKTATEERNYYGNKRRKKWDRLKSFVFVENKSQRKLVDQVLKHERLGRGELISQFFKQLESGKVKRVSRFFVLHD